MLSKKKVEMVKHFYKEYISIQGFENLVDRLLNYTRWVIYLESKRQIYSPLSNWTHEIDNLVHSDPASSGKYRIREFRSR